MLKRAFLNFMGLGLSFILILSSCTNTSLPWRSGYLVAQLYRQYKEEVILAYNNFSNDMIIDTQNGYSRAYFDNYRQQMIFKKERALEYMIDGRPFTTASDKLSGYISEILVNDKYQIGVEILNPEADSFGEGLFWSTKSRVIDLNTQESVIVDGLLFNDNLIADDYFYGVTFSKSDRELATDAVAGSEPMDYYLDIIDLRTMQHQKINTTENDIRFLYQMGNKVYGQAESQKQHFYLMR